MKIGIYNYEGAELELIQDEALLSESNSFTLVVGKNGIGKSRLISAIAKELIQRYDYDYDDEEEPLVIAVSTSPFDKFPIISRFKLKNHSNFRYIGLRGDGSAFTSSSISLMSSAARGLLGGALHGNHGVSFLEVFASLHFRPRSTYMLKPVFDKATDEFKATSEKEYFFVEPVESTGPIRVDKRYQAIFEALGTEEQSSVEYAMDHVASYYYSRKAIELEFNFVTSTAYINGKKLPPYILNSIVILMKLGLIRLMDLILEKENHGPISLRRASSGEQCLLIIMLGIAGHIRNGSVILIDEPEISLHPRWQEEFMPMLISAFSKYSDCQFIVATHSPQIVSCATSEFSYVLELESGVLHKSKDFNNKSADFQLAELFGAPGRMNEYVSRLGFDLIAKIRSRSKIDAEILDGLNRLLAFKPNLSSEDPVKKLIISVEELVSHYASH
ncbi:AAA family ATPase [Pseudomonas viridiflava]|uniref:AAA family ATPase n=1 Tax=Pseudomonas syringae group TaxID=136849 RepID=UPI001E5A581D|nr:ATP-binding protein [Pseudomonas viridiflava]